MPAVAADEGCEATAEESHSVGLAEVAASLQLSVGAQWSKARGGWKHSADSYKDKVSARPWTPGFSKPEACLTASALLL